LDSVTTYESQLAASPHNRIEAENPIASGRIGNHWHDLDHQLEQIVAVVGPPPNDSELRVELGPYLAVGGQGFGIAFSGCGDQRPSHVAYAKRVMDAFPDLQLVVYSAALHYAAYRQLG
jgi:hypothetical protein